MVHYGKHIIDPQTGLCEICDRGEIFEIRKGKHGKQFLYSNEDGKFTYRPNDEDENNYEKEATPRPVRKTNHPVSTVAPPNRVNSNDHPVHDDVRNHGQSHLATLYHVGSTGHMTSQNHGASGDSSRTYIVDNHHSPPVRPTHAAPRRARTPPPPVNNSWRGPARRNNNSDTRIIERAHRERHDDPEFYRPPGRPEIYHVEVSHSHNNNFTTLHANTPSPRINHHVDSQRKPRHLEPIQAPPTRKSQNKLQPHHEHEDRYIPSHTHRQPNRRVEKLHTTPRHHDSTPPLSNRAHDYPTYNKNPSIYHIQSVNSY